MDQFESRNRPNICQHSFVSVGTLVCLVSAHLVATKTGEVRVGTSDSSLGYRRRLSPNHVVYGLRRGFFSRMGSFWNFLNRPSTCSVPRKASRQFCFSMLINKHKGIVSTGSHTLFRRVMHLFFENYALQTIPPMKKHQFRSFLTFIFV